MKTGRPNKPRPTYLLVLGTLVIVAAVLLTVFMGPEAHGDTGVDNTAPSTAPVRVHLRACLSDEAESAFPCAWHALSMGNKRGHSFRIFADGRVRMIGHARAFHLLGDCDSNGPIYC